MEYRANPTYENEERMRYWRYMGQTTGRVRVTMIPMRQRTAITNSAKMNISTFCAVTENLKLPMMKRVSLFSSASSDAIIGIHSIDVYLSWNIRNKLTQNNK